MRRTKKPVVGGVALSLQFFAGDVGRTRDGREAGIRETGLDYGHSDVSARVELGADDRGSGTWQYVSPALHTPYAREKATREYLGVHCPEGALLWQSGYNDADFALDIVEKL